VGSPIGPGWLRCLASRAHGSGGDLRGYVEDRHDAPQSGYEHMLAGNEMMRGIA
jgi:hypothetical protein